MTTYLAAAEPNMSVVILITGFVVVFAVLILLIGIIWAYSKIVSSVQGAAQKRKDKKQAQQAEVATPEVESAPVVTSQETAPSDGSLDLQTVAVIAAAAQAFYGEGKVRVVGIRLAAGANTRSQWATAGLLESIPKMRSEGLL